MHITTSKIKIFSIAIMAAAVFGCSSGNNSAPLLDSTGKHPADWLHNHKTAGLASYDQCIGCHGTNEAGGITAGCMSCHVLSDPRTPARQSTCSSCHGGPQESGPYGDPAAPASYKAPNRAFSHGPHTGLPQVIADTTSTTSCANACHNGYGPGKATHSDGKVDVVIPSGYYVSTTKAAAYSSGTCSNVGCHGGQLTPDWKTMKWGATAAFRNTSTYNMKTDCRNCHEPLADTTVSYNYYYSGKHAFHLDPAQVESRVAPLRGPAYDFTARIFCTDCHNTNVLADQTKHFSGIATPSRTTVTAAAAVTVAPSPTSSAFFVYSSSATKKCSNVSCHPNRIGMPWN